MKPYGRGLNKSDNGNCSQILAFGNTFPPNIKSISDENRTVDFIITSDEPDRDNDVIDPKGWNLKSFKANPVVLWSHDYQLPPIAKAIRVGKVEGGLKSRAQFVPPDVSPFAESIFQMIKGGFLNAASVGFRPTEWEFNEKRGGMDFKKQELLEWSVVPVPANADATVIDGIKAKGINVAPILEWGELFIENGEQDEHERDVVKAFCKALGSVQVAVADTSSDGDTEEKGVDDNEWKDDDPVGVYDADTKGIPEFDEERLAKEGKSSTKKQEELATQVSHEIANIISNPDSNVGGVIRHSLGLRVGPALFPQAETLVPKSVLDGLTISEGSTIDESGKDAEDESPCEHCGKSFKQHELIGNYEYEEGVDEQLLLCKDCTTKNILVSVDLQVKSDDDLVVEVLENEEELAGIDSDMAKAVLKEIVPSLIKTQIAAEVEKGIAYAQGRIL